MQDRVSLPGDGAPHGDERGFDRQLERLLALCLDAANADCVALVADDGPHAVRAIARRADGAALVATPPASSLEMPWSVVDPVFATGEPFFDGARAALPVKSDGQLVGVLYVERGERGDSSSRERSELLRLLTESLGVALDNQRLDEERRHSEAALRLCTEATSALQHRLSESIRARDERDRYLKLIFRALPGAVWAFDRELRYTYATGRLFGLHGVDPAKLMAGGTLFDFLGTSDPANPAVAHHQRALAGARQSFEYELSGRWYRVLVEPIRDGGGQVIGCVGVGFDITDERRALERLEKSESRLAEAQAVAHIGSFEWDIEPNVVTWSDELYRIYGVEPGQFGGTFEAFLERIFPGDLESTKNVVFDAYRSGKPFTYDHRVVRADGRVLMLHTRAELKRDEQGRPVRMIGTCWDVTAVTEANRERERALSLWRATIEATADGIVVIDRDRRVSAMNQRFLELWSVPPSVAQRREERPLVMAMVDQLEDPEAFLRIVELRYAHPEAECIDVVRLRDGRVFERSTRPQRIGEEIVGTVVCFRDISDRERLLRRALFLADVSRLLVSLDVEQALEGVAHMAVPYLGDGCAIDLFGDGGPRRLLAVSRDSQRPMSPSLHPSVLSGHAIVYQVGALSYLGVPLMMKGTLGGAISVCAAPHRKYGPSDIELVEELGRRAALAIENARLYQHAHEALKARDEFLTIAAHEIRGPVTSIHLAVQALHDGTMPAETVSQLLDVVEREDRRLSRFVNELLDLGRLRSGLQLDVEEVDLVEVVREVVSRVGRELSRSGSALTVTARRPVVGQWDRFRVEQVVYNLITNAIKFGLGRPIEVRVVSEERRAILAVEDHGIGIAPEARSRIFEAFERGVSVRHYGGLGLGLHIVKTIVEALGGTVDVDSQPGAGSTFTVVLPQARH